MPRIVEQLLGVHRLAVRDAFAKGDQADLVALSVIATKDTVEPMRLSEATARMVALTGRLLNVSVPHGCCPL